MTLGIGNCPNSAQAKVWPNELLELLALSQIIFVADQSVFHCHHDQAFHPGHTGLEWKEEMETRARGNLLSQ